MLEHLKPYLQEQDDDAQGGGGGGEPVDRKRYVQAQLDERYRSREVREFLARYRDDANVALEHALKDSDEVIRRLMKRQAELEYDLKAAQSEVTQEREARQKVEQERDEVAANLEQRTRGEREAKIDQLLEERLRDKTLVRRHRAYLNLDGYALELDGDKVMLTKDGRRHNFDTVVNDAWYERFDDARPSSDTPLPQAPASAGRVGSNGQATGFDPKAAAEEFGRQAAANRQLTQIPGVTNG